MQIPAHILLQAVDLYLKNAYPGGIPLPVEARLGPIREMAAAAPPGTDPLISLDPAGPAQGLLERDPANPVESYALRLGQPLYPHMKLVAEPLPSSPSAVMADRGNVAAEGEESPAGAAGGGQKGGQEGVGKRGAGGSASSGFILRVDSHDRHLHASPGSPDATWLESVRLSNKELGERIESAWAAAGLPTFKEYLRRQLEARKRAKSE